MSKIKVYVSGKITGLPIEVAKENFETLCEAVRAYGHDAINPIDIAPFNPEWTWEQYMRVDLIALLGCDCILMHENWIESKGAKVEHDLAISVGMPVHYSIEPLKTK